MNLYIEIPMTPSGDLGPNGRVNWRTKNRLTTTARSCARYAALEAVLGAEGVALALQSAKEVKVAWVVKWEPRRKIMDQDNLIGCLKSFQDGICDTLAINDRKVRVLSVTQERDPDGMGCVAVTLMPIEHRE